MRYILTQRGIVLILLIDISLYIPENRDVSSMMHAICFSCVSHLIPGCKLLIRTMEFPIKYLRIC